MVLRRYERTRKGDNLATMRMMDLLNNVFASPLADLAGQPLLEDMKATRVQRADNRVDVVGAELAEHATGSDDGTGRMVQT